MPDGAPYANTEGCWNALTEASKVARYLDLVPLDAFEDRRNPAPRIFAMPSGRGWSDIQPFVYGGKVDYVWVPPSPTFDLPGYLVAGRVEQRYRLEIWCEKSTMNDVLVPLCQRRRVDLVTGLGEMSISAVRDLIRRIAEGTKATRVLYISDFDPGGESMPRAVARKAEWLIRRDVIDVDFRLRPIVLTPEHITEFGLPRTPIKEKESRRPVSRNAMVAALTELDALEALHPGTLAEIVEREIKRYHDDTLERRLRDAQFPLQRALMPIEKEVHAEHEETIAELRAEYKAITEGIAERLARLSSRCRRAVSHSDKRSR